MYFTTAAAEPVESRGPRKTVEGGPGREAGDVKRKKGKYGVSGRSPMCALLLPLSLLALAARRNLPSISRRLQLHGDKKRVT